MRLVGDPREVEELLAALGRVAHLADVTRRGSRYSAAEVRVYAHVEPVAVGEIPDAGAVGSGAARALGAGQ